MSQCVDCYWLINSRNKEFFDNVLNIFLPLRQESSLEYSIYGIKDFETVNELMNYLEINKNQDYSIYWNNLDNNSLYKDIVLIYTDDGSVIIGISIIGNNPKEEKILNEYCSICEFLNSSIGCITVEEVAPDNSKEFQEFCNSRYIPNCNKANLE